MGVDDSTSGVHAVDAGRITDTHHQAIVNAGDGARVALEIVRKVDPEFYNDWIAPDGYYERYDREVPAAVEEINHNERRKRAEHANEHMRTFFGSG